MPFDPTLLMDKVARMAAKMDETAKNLLSITMENDQIRIDATTAKAEAENHIILLQDQVDELTRT